MSKNFELLQQILSDEELFRSSHLEESESADAVPPASEGTPSPQNEECVRERVLRNTSLPSVLVPVEDVPELSPLPNPDDLRVSEKQARRNLGEACGAEFPETSGTPIPVEDPPMEDVTKSDEARIDRLREGANKNPVQPHRSILSLFPPTYEASPTSKKVCASPISKISFGITWLDIVKAGVKHWIKEATDKTNGRSCDWETVAREEEIKLVQRVFPETPEGSRRMALFSGMESNSGCASVCVRVAKILAARGDGEVCLVDADFQSPSLHRYFGVENTHGLAEVAFESFPPSMCLQKVDDPRLWLMPCGQAASKLTFPAITDGLRRRISELRDKFRYVVIHAGPVRMETCALQISRWTDGVVIILEANCTRRDTAKRIKETLLAANINLLGVVLNNRTFPIPDSIYRKL